MKLNIPLERKYHLAYWAIGGCLFFTAASSLINPYFAIVFLASSIVGLPALVLYFTNRTHGIIGSFFKLLGLLIYASIANSVLVPELTKAIHRVVT